MILGDSTIREYIASGVIRQRWQGTEDPVGPASLDVHLGRYGLVPRLNHPDPEAPWGPIANINAPPGPEHYRRADLRGGVLLHPGDVMLVETAEVLDLPLDVAARVAARSSAGRMFLRVCACAGYVDPGFKGSITLELHNAGRWPWRLTEGDRLAQLVFERVEGCTRGYAETGRYQAQDGPTPAR